MAVVITQLTVSWQSIMVTRAKPWTASSYK
jgi:hypothetical protein